METIKVRGLVIKEFETGESDKRLLLLCKEHGRLLVYARGARKQKSKFIAAAQLFVYADFVLAKGRGFYSVNAAEVIENFYALRTDYDRLIAAHLICEVCEKTVMEQMESDECLRITLKSLQHLCKGHMPEEQILSVFLYKIFDDHGLAPHIHECVICGALMDAPTNAVLTPEGLCCAVHTINAGKHIEAPTVAALKHILEHDLADAFRFCIDGQNLKQLLSAAIMLWDHHFEWTLKSYESV